LKYGWKCYFSEATFTESFLGMIIIMKTKQDTDLSQACDPTFNGLFFRWVKLNVHSVFGESKSIILVCFSGRKVFKPCIINLESLNWFVGIGTLFKALEQKLMKIRYLVEAKKLLVKGKYSCFGSWRGRMSVHESTINDRWCVEISWVKMADGKEIKAQRRVSIVKKRDWERSFLHRVTSGCLVYRAEKKK